MIASVMLIIDIRHVLKLRGIDQPYKFLVKNGFTPSTASRWANNSVGYIRPKHLETLCVALNCTPNDLCTWLPDTKMPLAGHHALNSLVRTEPTPSLTELARDLPPEKLAQLIASFE